MALSFYFYPLFSRPFITLTLLHFSFIILTIILFNSQIQFFFKLGVVFNFWVFGFLISFGIQSFVSAFKEPSIYTVFSVQEVPISPMDKVFEQ